MENEAVNFIFFAALLNAGEFQGDIIGFPG